jgi:hypothetical protein
MNLLKLTFTQAMLYILLVILAYELSRLLWRKFWQRFYYRQARKQVTSEITITVSVPRASKLDPQALADQFYAESFGESLQKRVKEQ